MLSPKKVKYRKSQKGRMKGAAYRGSDLSFGEFGLQATDCGKISSKQIEAARIAMTRHVKRGGKSGSAYSRTNRLPRSLLKSVWVKEKAHLKGGWP